MLGSIVKDVKTMLEPYQADVVKLQQTLEETNRLLREQIEATKELTAAMRPPISFNR